MVEILGPKFPKTFLKFNLFKAGICSPVPLYGAQLKLDLQTELS